MNILHLYKDYFPVVGGIENHIKLLAEAQARRGHSVTVLVTSPTHTFRETTIGGVRVIFAGRWFTLSSAPISTELFRRVAELTPDITHLHHPYPVGEVAHLLGGRARATVITYHSDIVRQRVFGALYAPIQRRVLGMAHTIIATSPNYIRSSPILSRWRDKCVVVPLAIPIHPEQPAETVSKGKGNELLFVGRLSYYKGLNYLLEALVWLPEARLTVVGAGPREQEWKRQAAVPELGERVIWKGALEDAELRAEYAKCDIFVLPCSERSEAFGTVQLEAMAAGKPVVSCDVETGVAWVNQDQVTGIVVAPRNANALAAAIRCLMNDAALRANFGAAGRRRIETGFTIEKMVLGVEQVYAVAIGSGDETVTRPTVE